MLAIQFIVRLRKYLSKVHLKGTQSAKGPRWPGHYFSQFEKRRFTSTRNQIYASDTSRNPLQSYLVFHSILELLLKISFLSKLFTHPITLIILSYLVKNSIQRNLNRRGEKRVGAGWEKSPSFTK